jgi:hypothetical protein
MLAAVIENGIVANVIVVESLDVISGLIDGEGAAIGDAWDGGQFIRPEPPPTTPIVPSRIPMLNAHLALIDADWMGQVITYINSIPGADGAKARAYLGQALTMERNHPLVLSITAAIGKTEDDVDQLFIQAGAMNV